MSKITMKKETNETVRQCFERFIERKECENTSPKTINTYNVHFNIFMKFIACEDMLMVDMNETIINDFIKYLRSERNCKDATIKSYISSLRAFLYNCMEYGEKERFNIKMPKTKVNTKEIYTEEELRILLVKPKSNSFVEFRTWFYINLLYGTGIRLESALRLKVKDFDFEKDTVRIYNTKSRRTQTLYMGKALNKIAREYLLIRKGEPEDSLFCDVYGNPIKNRTLQDALARYNRSRGVTKTSSHLFRHLFAVEFLETTNNIVDLQRWLGHNDVKTTQNYIKNYLPDYGDNFDDVSPLSRFYINTNDKNIAMKREKIVR